MGYQKTIRIALVALLSLLPVACFADWNGLQGSGQAGTKTLAHQGFTSIAVGQAFEVQIRRAPDFSLEVQVDDNFLPHLDIEQRGSHLRIGMDRGHSYRPSEVGMRVVVTMPVLEAIEASGASTVSLEGFNRMEELRLQASGASSLQGEVQAGRCQVQLSGASRCRLGGQVDTLDLTASGASRANLTKLQTRTTQVRLSGASQAELMVTEEIRARASGASSLFYEGNPAVSELDHSGASSIRKR